MRHRWTGWFPLCPLSSTLKTGSNVACVNSRLRWRAAAPNYGPAPATSRYAQAPARSEPPVNTQRQGLYDTHVLRKTNTSRINHSVAEPQPKANHKGHKGFTKDTEESV